MNAAKTSTPVTFAPIEALEDRKLMASAPWGPYPVMLGLDKVVAEYPWLNGSGFGVAVIDKGIDYRHPLLPASRIKNVIDYVDGDTDPFPSTPQSVDVSTAHGTGVAGILVGVPTVQTSAQDRKQYQYQGVLQQGNVYNLRTDRNRSQETITQALQWVVDNHEQYNITAVNLTDFVGSSAASPLYATQVKKLWDAGVFVATPVANDWLGDPKRNAPPRQRIGNPGQSPHIFGVGGVRRDGTLRPQSQRGEHLDLLGPAQDVGLPYYTPETDEHTWTDQGQGNSWATPYVVGAAVLLQQIDPTLRPADVMRIMQDSGVYVADTVDAGFTGIAGYKRLDAYAAVQRTFATRDDASDAGAGNDTLGTATAIGLNASGNGSVSGRKLLARDADFYTFTVSRAGKYDVSAVSGAQLLNASGGVIASMGATGLQGQTLAAGTYYVRAYNGNAGLDGTYGVTITARSLDQEPPPPPPPGTPGQGGTFNDLKYDASDRLHFAWYDASSKTLKYALRAANGTWGGVQTIDSAPDVGNFVSLALDGAGRPGVAYYDATNADLKYAKLNGSSWSVETVESTNTVGYYPSLKYDAADRPVIAYYYRTSGDLRLAAHDGSGWEVTAIDTAGDVGRYPSLALNPATERWAVAYETTSGGAFKYAQRTRSGWATEVVDENGEGGGFVSLAFDDGSRPAFTYYDAKNADLKLARSNGSVWSKTVIAAKNSQGLYSNLFFDAGSPVVYYFNKTGRTLNAARVEGGGWAYELLASGGGRENRVSMKSDGTETYSLFDEATGGLKVADL